MKGATQSAKSSRAQSKARAKESAKTPVKVAAAAAKPRDIGRIFMHGRSQAVRLPKEFRLPGDKVRVRREGQNLVLTPIERDWDAFWAEIDQRSGGVPFMSQGREQPPMPSDDDPRYKWD